MPVMTTMDQQESPFEVAPAHPRQRHRWRRSVATMVIAVTVMWLFSAAALVIYTRNARVATTRTLVIPQGTTDLIAAGENPLQIPSTWSFYTDDILLLINEDTIDHYLGTYFVAAETTSRHQLQPSFGGFQFCSLHPSGQIAIEVEPRTFDWRQTIFPTLALGPALGLIVLGTRRVMALLDDGPGIVHRSNEGEQST